MVAITSVELPTSFYRKVRRVTQNDLMNDQRSVNLIEPIG